MHSFMGDWQAKVIRVGCTRESTKSSHESGGLSVNFKRFTASVHGEWGNEQSVKHTPVCYQFNLLRLGEVDELHMYGGIIKANFGIGHIRKLVMHHQVDTGQQSGGGFGFTFPLTPSAVSDSALDAVKSVSVSVSGGGMVRLDGGRCIFDVPGITWDEKVVLGLPVKEYDTRTRVTATWNNTNLGESAPTATTAVGSIGMQVGDVHVHMDIPSGVIPGHEGREQAWHERTKAELTAKAKREPLDKEEQKKLQTSQAFLKAAAEKRKEELLEKRKARTLTREEAEELQPILDLEAAERAARQQAEVDRIKAEEKALHDRIHAEAREKEQAERKAALKAKHKAGKLSASEREEYQDLLDREAAQRAAQQPQPAVASGKAPEVARGGDDSTHLDLMDMIEIDEQTMQAITDFDRITAQMTDGEKAQLERVMSVYDPTKSDAENASAMKALPEMQSLHDRYSILGTWRDEDNLHPDKSLIDREIVEYHKMIKVLEALPAGDSRKSALEFYQEALDHKLEIKHSGRFGLGMVQGGKLSAEYIAEGYLGGVLCKVLKLGYLAARGHQVLKAGETLPYLFKGGNAARRIAKPMIDTWRIPGEVTQLARQLQQATKTYGGRLLYTKGQGYQIVIPNGKKEIMIRIMDKGGQQSQPYWRVSVEGKGAFDLRGKIETIPELTHHSLTENSLSQITRILRQNGIIK